MNWKLADKLLRVQGSRMISTIFGWEIVSEGLHYKIHPKVAKTILDRDIVVIANKKIHITSYRHKEELK